MSEEKENKEVSQNKKGEEESKNEEKEVKKITFGSIFGWVFGVLMLLVGISSLFTDFWVGVISLLIACITLPPFNKKVLEQRLNLSLSTGLKVVIVIILFVLMGVAIPSEELENESTNNEQPQTETDTENETDEIEVEVDDDESSVEEDEAIKEEDVVKASAKEVLSAFEDNEARGNKLYKDKRIELTGTISRISHSDFAEERYTLSIGTGEDFEYTTIDISADMSFEDELMELNEGDQITVLFDCEGLISNLYVEGDLVEIK